MKLCPLADLVGGNILSLWCDVTSFAQQVVSRNAIVIKGHEARMES